MASVMRSKLGNFAHKYVQTFLLQSYKIKIKPRLCFHNSSILYVAGQELKMPSLSPTMTEGTIVRWLKKEGDKVSPGDVLCEIQTDKAVMSFETEEEGILAKILVPDDTKDVKVGTLIALMVAEGEDWKSVEIPPSSGSPPAAAGAPAPTSAAGQFAGVELTMPSLSPTMTEGTIVKWLKKEGDKVSPGDALCEIQTDKAVMTFETEEEGILAKILVPDDTKEVKVGALIALMVGEEEDWKSVAIPQSPGSRPSAAPTSAAGDTSPHPSSGSTYMSYGPSVRYLLEQYNLGSDKVAPTGYRNKLLKSDVLKFIERNNLKPVPLKTVPPPTTATSPGASKPMPAKKSGAGFVDIEVTGMRRTIAKRLTESKTTIPHAYGNTSCKIDKIIAMRKQLKSKGIALSVNDFVIKAVATALRQCPEMNLLWINGQAVHTPNIDISIAVSTPTGLITPIVVNASRKGLEEISADVKSLAAKAREGKLQLHEFQGGSFTISNLGMFGISEFSAIINPPQCGILAIGGGQLYLGQDGKPTTTMTVTLSYDRRAIDEFDAAQFLETVKAMLEEPSMLTLGGQHSLRAKLFV